MNEKHITAISNVLTQWNPLGESANSVSDLNGYRVEAIDIIIAL